MTLSELNESGFKNSEEYKLFKKKLIDFWGSLNSMQKSELWCLWDNGILYSGSYENMVDSIIVDEN